MEKSSMAVEQRLVEELLARGVQREPQLLINVEKIVSATTLTEWWSLMRGSVGPELSQLHWDILSFCKAYELTAHQIQLRRDALACVERAVRQIWPRAEVHLFGSGATDLALPWSDIDVAIIPPERDLTFRNPTPMQWQNALSKKLNLFGQCRSLKTVPHARVPLLKIIFNSGIACDVSFDARNSQAGVAVIRQFMRQYESLRPLCLVLKFFLGQNNLNEVHTGGLGSFCILTMVFSHLQRMGSIIETERRDLGILLLSFFAHFSNMHNYNTDVVSTRADSRNSCKVDKGWVNVKMPNLLAVEDPLDPTSDMGKGSYKIEEVRTKFSQAQRTLLTHWYNKHVLAQIIDMTANPNQRPVAEKSKKSKRGGKKRRRAASPQDHQPALKAQRTLYHPRQGSGLVTRSQLDRILANYGDQHFTSGLRSKRLRSREFDEENFYSAELNFASKTSAKQGRDFLRRTQGNTVDSDSLDSNSSPRHQDYIEEDCRAVRTVNSQFSQEGSKVLEPRVNPGQCGDLSRGRQDCSRGSASLEASHLTPRKKSRESLRHEDPKEEFVPGQSAAQSHLRYDGMDAGEKHDETINLEFWESQLTTRSRPRKTSLKQRENQIQFAEICRGQDSPRTSDSLVASNSTPVVELRNGPKHKAHEKDCCQPIQAANSHPRQDVDSEGMRGSQDERLLVDFWESHLTTPKSSKASLKHCDVGGNATPGEAVETLHPGQPQSCSKIVTKTRDEKLPWQSETEGNNEDAQAVPNIDLGRTQKGSKIHPTEEDLKLLQHYVNRGINEPVKVGEIHRERPQTEGEVWPSMQSERLLQNCGACGHNEHDRAVQTVHSERPKIGRKLHLFQEYGTASNTEGAQAVRIILPESPENGGKQQAKAQHEKSIKKSTPGEPQNFCKMYSKSDDEKSVEHYCTGGNREHTVAAQIIQPRRSQNGRKIRPEAEDEKLEVDLDFWEAQLTTKRKSRSGALIHQSSRGVGGRDFQPAVSIHSEPPGQGKDAVVGEVRGKENLVDLPELLLAKKLKSRAGSLQHGVEGQTNQREHTVHHEQPPQCGDLEDESKGQDQEIWMDFWEAQLAPRLKSQKGALSNLHPPAGAVEDAPRQPNSFKSCSLQDGTGVNGAVLPLKIEDAGQPQDLTGRSADEVMLEDFWEAQLAPRLKATNCLSKPVADRCEGEDARPEQKCHPDQPSDERDVNERSGDERVLLEFWEAELAPRLKSRKYSSKLLAAECEEEDKPAQKSQLGVASEDERKLVDFWETHLNPKPKSLNDQQAAEGGVEGGTKKGKDEEYDRILADFWEAHLTPNFKSSKGPSKQDVEKTHQELSTRPGSSFAGRSRDETTLRTFWEAYLNPAISRKGYLRSNSTKVI